jgi:protease-4
MDGLHSVGRAAIALVAAAIAAVAGWLLFVEAPADMAELLGVLFVIVTVVVGLRIASTIAGNVFPEYNVAEVAVEGPITRDGGGFSPGAPGVPGADEIVDLIEQADADDNADALLLRLNTPGGAVVPSDDIRRAAESFDGPTVAYATDTCASGGYWIASGCDELWAREGSIVGSIGVRGSRMTASEFLDKAGLQYEQFTAGEYKEAGTPFAEMDDDEREYLQGLIDDYYDQFVSNVAERRELDRETIEETEARVYIGTQAAEEGLVDELGTRDDVIETLEERLGTDVSVREFEPQFPLAQRIQVGAQRFAFAFGAGIASIFTDEGGQFKFR